MLFFLNSVFSYFMSVFCLKNVCLSFFIFCVYSLYSPFLLAQNSDTDTLYNTPYDTIYTKRKIKLIRKELATNKYKKGTIELYSSPFALLELTTPTLYLGSEYFIKDRFSIYTDFGYMFPIFRSELNTEVDPLLSAQENKTDQLILNSARANYVIKSEFRWYRENSSPKDAFYYGIRLMFRNVNYLKNQQTSEEYIFSTLTNNWTAVGQENITIYRVRRRSFGVQFLVGYKDSFLKKFSSNLYMGVGVRYISNQPTNKAFDPFEDVDSFFEELDMDFVKFNKQYKFVTMDFALGLRFGGRIKH